jgi:hypothetical protein
VELNSGASGNPVAMTLEMLVELCKYRSGEWSVTNTPWEARKLVQDGLLLERWTILEWEFQLTSAGEMVQKAALGAAEGALGVAQAMGQTPTSPGFAQKA